ncbi:unnamed protein product [Lactuca saligna]|uniref:Uncharacterized protein n=1 Tax=Lactuca saligna TaxID=75948 RepID=A0AA35ZG97_LACSI|nr:unnamed protein product [Lactuca saligna]
MKKFPTCTPDLRIVAEGDDVVTTSQKVNLRDELENICKALQGDKSYWYQQFIPMLPCILSADDEQSKSRLQVFLWALLAVRSQFGMLDDGARIHVIPHLFREAVDCGKLMLETSIVGRDESLDTSSVSKEFGTIHNLIQKDCVRIAVSDEVKYLRNSRAEQTKQVAEFHVRMNEIISSDLNQRRAFEDDIHSSLSSILASDDSIGASFPHSHVSEEVAAICDAKLKSSDIQAVVLFIYFPHSHVRVVVEVMVKQNNVFPNKEMQWQQKVVKVFPRPAVSLCPQVHCETSKYNMKLREDRGFSLEELKVNPDMVLQLENVGLSFTGKGESSQRKLIASGSHAGEEEGTHVILQLSNSPKSKVSVVRNEQGGNSVTTVLLRGSADSILDDLERPVDDGVNTYKALCKDSRIVLGAAATEIELATKLKEFSFSETW